MYLAAKHVQPSKDYTVIVTFENNEKRIFDVKPLLNKGIFSALRKPDEFNSVRISFDTIEWNNGADIDPEFLYSNSIPL